MRAMTLPRETPRGISAALSPKAPPSMLEHADAWEQQLEQHSPDQPIMHLVASMRCSYAGALGPVWSWAFPSRIKSLVLFRRRKST